MKKTVIYIVTALFILCFIAGTAYAKRWNKRKMAGQYSFAAGSLFNGTAVLAKDRGTTKLPYTPNAHSVVGKWKLKKHKQFVTIDWPDMAHFEGYIVNLDTITGQYTDVDFNSAVCTLNRITNIINLAHVHIDRTRNKRVKGYVFYNYATKDFNKRHYRIVVYSRFSNSVANIVKTAERKLKSRLTKFGFFNRDINKGFDFVECYVISKNFDPPLESTNSPALPLDGTNVFAYDWQPPGFKWFDWSSTNYY